MSNVKWSDDTAFPPSISGAGAQVVGLDAGGANAKFPVSGLTLISSGKITSPVAYFDVALPSGYSRYFLAGDNMKLSTLDTLANTWSADGGTTFFCDPENLDTYAWVQNFFSLNADGTLGNDQRAFFDADSLVYFADDPGTTGSLTHFDFVFWPGSSVAAPLAHIREMAIALDAGSGQSVIENVDTAWTLSPFPTAGPAVLARINLVRVLPYGNGDCNPPTSSNTITQGSWTLFGVPTP